MSSTMQIPILGAPPTRPGTTDRCRPTEPLFARLLDATALVQTGDRDAATSLLEGILADAPADGRADQRVARHFVAGLRARMDDDTAAMGNLYRDAPDPDAMLAAFETLLRHTPAIRFGYAAATEALIARLAGARHVHLVDIGIGTGAQWAYALGPLARGLVRVERLRLTGVDLPAPGPDPAIRLRAIGADLSRRATALGLPFEFDPVAAPVEELNAGGIGHRPGEALAVNTAFALHHVLPSEGGGASGRDRDSFLRTLHGLKPRVVTLVEPDVEHNALPFASRVPASLTHYAAVFELLAALLPADLPARRVIEDAFFGREIRNVLVGEGAGRVERHESRGAWRTRLERQGFAALDLGWSARRIVRAAGSRRPCTVGTDRGMLVLRWRRTPLVAASAWVPAEDHPSAY